MALVQLFPITGRQKEAVIDPGAVGKNGYEDLNSLEEDQVLGPGQQGQQVERDLDRQEHRHQGNQGQQRSPVDQNQQGHHQHHRQPSGGPDALNLRPGMIAADDRTAAQGNFQPLRHLPFIAELVDQFLDFLDGVPVILGKKFRRQLEYHQQGLAIRTDEQGADAGSVGRANSGDNGPLLRLGWALVGKQISFSGFNFKRQSPVLLGKVLEFRLENLVNEFQVFLKMGLFLVGPVQEEDNAAGQTILREGLGKLLLGAAAGRVRRQEGEFSILSDFIPGRRSEPGDQKQKGPDGQQKGPPPTNDQRKSAKYHGSIWARKPLRAQSVSEGVRLPLSLTLWARTQVIPDLTNFTWKWTLARSAPHTPSVFGPGLARIFPGRKRNP